MDSQAKIYELLKKYWGYDEFRPMQREIINSVLARRDTLALLPTGGGKSLTYQIPALMSEGVCIVVTPLIALMKDQVDQLRAKSISAVAIHSGLTRRQIDIALDNCAYGDVKFIYLSPERLTSDLFRTRLQRLEISLLAVDEAHCISQWGHDFRPSYLRIGEIIPAIGKAPILALTASATDMVASDIMSNLHFGEPHILRGNFSRPNLVYAVRQIEDKNEQLLRIISNVEGSGIVYARTRAGVEQIAKLLIENQIPASFYHGGIPHTERSIRQEEWKNNKVRVIVATNAFGMGIDKPDVRFVVHYTMCDSLENYYQEAGRAGRDGKRSYALLMVSLDDNGRVEKRFESEFPPIERIKDIYEKICSSLQIAIGDGALSSHTFNIYEFCSREHLYRGEVASALKLLQMNNYMTLTDELDNPARIMFTVGRDELYKVRIDREDLDHIIKVVLRLYEGLFSNFRQIDEVQIAHWSGYTIPKVQDLLKRMWQLRLIRYIPSNRSPLIFLHEERLPIEDLYIAPETYKYRRELIRERFNNMLEYINNVDECRSIILERHFGVENPKACGVCDVCIANRRAQSAKDQSITEEITTLLSNETMSVKQIVVKIKRDPKLIVEAIDTLLESHTITYLDNGHLKLR